MRYGRHVTLPCRDGVTRTAFYQPFELDLMADLRAQLDTPARGHAKESMFVLHELKALFPGSEILEDEIAEIATEQLELSDPDEQTIGAFHGPDVGAPDTERKAALDVYPRTGTQRRAVLDFIATAGDRGATDDEAREATGVRRARTRRHELMEGGWVEDSGRQRKLQTGNLAEIWVLTDAGRRNWKQA